MKYLKKKNNRKYNVSRETLYQLYKVALLLIAIIPMTTPSFYAIEVIPGLTTDKYLLVDKESEMILAGENYDQVTGIASITKLMSYYVYMDKIKTDKIDVEQAVVPVSDVIVDNFAKDSALSGVYFEYGSKYPLTEMFDLMMVYSDNGATKAIGEFLFGSEEEAVVAMNKKAKALGLENTMYFNTTGLTMVDYKDAMLKGTKKTDYNTSTAREQLILAESILDKYPEILDVVGKSTIKFEGTELPSFNLMLPGLSYEFDGVKGLKTGSSIEAGYCFVGYYIDPETKEEYLSVVLDSESTTKRFNDTTYVYQWLDDAKLEILKPKGEESQLRIKGAKQSEYTVTVAADYRIPESDTFTLERQKFEFNSKYFNENDKLMTDIPAGESIGSYVYTVAEDDVKENNFEALTTEPNTIKIEVVSTTEIKKEGFIGSVFTGITSFFVNVFESM